MKPFLRDNLLDTEQIFNYRLSRGRRVVENASGIFRNRFRCLFTTMQQTPNVVESIGLACCCLHNIMRLQYPALQNSTLDQEEDNNGVIPGAWRNEANMQDMNNIVGGNHTARAAKEQPLYLTHYYNSPAQPLYLTHYYNSHAQPLYLTHYYNSPAQPLYLTHYYNSPAQPLYLTHYYNSPTSHCT